MKKPRIDDFDPNKAPTLGSPMDEMPEITKPTRGAASAVQTQAATDPGESQQTGAQEQHPTERSNVPPYGRTGKPRLIKRYAFEFYQDQLEVLKRISLEDKMEGGRGSMSEMVREALDQYIEQKRRAGR